MSTTTGVGLGSLNTSNGSTSVGATILGIDVNTLIETLVNAKSIANTTRQTKIDANTAKLSAYSTLQSKLTALNSSVKVLQNPKITSGITNAFNAKQALSRASGTIDAANLYGVSADSTATAGTYSITINRVAKTDTISGTMAITDTGTVNPISTDGVLSINGTTFNLTNAQTLTQIKDEINGSSSTTKVTASIVQAGASDYRLVLKSTVTGDAIDLTGSDASVLTDLGIAASGATDTSLSAEVVLDGVTVTRSSNNINDLIQGVGITLFQADIGHPITLTIDPDLSGISDSIANFVTAYNDLVDFVQDQRKVGADGSVGEDQVLFSDSFLQSTYRSLQSVIGAGASGIGGDGSGVLKSLRDIGIDLDQTGHLVGNDDTKFQNALLDKLDEVRDLFGFASNVSAGITVVDRPNIIPSALIGQTVTVRVTATDASGNPTAAEFERNGVISAATISNNFIKGVSGSEYEDFVVGYTGGVVSGTPYEATFKPTQGIADHLAGILEPILNTTSGSLKQTTSSLTSANTRLETQITDYKNQIEIYRTRLTLQFQAAQQAISLLTSTQDSIKAYANSLNSNN